MPRSPLASYRLECAAVFQVHVPGVFYIIPLLCSVVKMKTKQGIQVCVLRQKKDKWYGSPPPASMMDKFPITLLSCLQYSVFNCFQYWI